MTAGVAEEASELEEDVQRNSDEEDVDVSGGTYDGLDDENDDVNS